MNIHVYIDYRVACIIIFAYLKNANNGKNLLINKYSLCKRLYYYLYVYNYT